MRVGMMLATVLIAAGCGSSDTTGATPGAGGSAGVAGVAGVAGAAGVSGGAGTSGAGGAAGSDAGITSACVSIDRPIYQSKLAAGDPCRLPGADAQGPPEPAPADASAELDPVAPGPYPVGVVTLELQSAGRSILLEVWYPADASVVGQPTDVYTYAEEAPAGALDQIEAACLHIDPLASGAVRDAPPSGAGPFPLVIFSHGTTSTRIQSASQTSHLASHGFVVAAPDHTGDTLVEFFKNKGQQDPLSDPVSALAIANNRVADVKSVIDYMAAQDSASGSCFQGLVDTTKVGVFGHSFGGFTTLAASGGMVVGATADPRVAAAAPISPGGTSLTKASSDPLLAVGGELDVATPFDTEAKAAYDRSTVADKHLVKVLGAGHLTVSDMCAIKLQEQIDLFKFAPCNVCDIVAQGCPGGEAQALTVRPALQYFTTAFFTAELGAGSRADQAKALLDPGGAGPGKYPAVWSQVQVQ